MALTKVDAQLLNGAVNVDSSGNVGIGTSSPANKLDVSSSSNIYAYFQSTTDSNAGIRLKNTGRDYGIFTDGGNGSSNALRFYDFTASAERMRIDSSGNLLVGQTSTSPTTNGFNVNQTGGANIYAVNLAGNSSSSGTIAYSLYSTSLAQYQYYVAYNGSISARVTSINGLSDAREKTNVKELETGLAEVLKLQPRRFDWIDGSKSNVAGFIAQEVQAILPDLTEEYVVPEGQEERLGLRMGDMMPTLVKAIQELKAEVDSLKTQLGK